MSTDNKLPGKATTGLFMESGSRIANKNIFVHRF